MVTAARLKKSHWLFYTIAAGGAFAAFGTIIGLVWGNKMKEYALLAAISYVLSTVGFLFLVGWTFFRGDLDDVEAPKHKVIAAERDDEN